MKENTEQMKVLLTRALAAAPNDFSLSEARSLISRALQSVEAVESKRSKREAALQERKQGRIPLVQNPLSAWQAIEAELAHERKKLEEMKSRRGLPKLSQDEGDELSNVFG